MTPSGDREHPRSYLGRSVPGRDHMQRQPDLSSRGAPLLAEFVSLLCISFFTILGTLEGHSK